MSSAAFATEISGRENSLLGPWRSPQQMLHAQVYDSHASIHDDALLRGRARALDNEDRQRAHLQSGTEAVPESRE
jgi:hypothetical protein